MIPRLQTGRICACAAALAATVLLLTVPISQAVMHHSSATSGPSPSSPSKSSVTSFTTSGPDSALSAPVIKSSSAESQPKLSKSVNSTVAKSSSSVDDLTESQSAQSGSMLQTSGAPVHGHAQQHHYQHQHFQSQIQHTAPSHHRQSSASASSSALGGALGDLSPTASQPQAQAITGRNTQFSVNQAQLQQQMAMMGAKPGQFTLVSNQQVGPGHVTMIGYTTPIIKVGGIIKHEQVAPSSSRSTSDQLRAQPQSHASLVHEPRPSVSAVPQRQESSSNAAAPATSSMGSQASASAMNDAKMYYEKPPLSQMGIPSHPGFYGPEAGRALGLSNYRLAQDGIQQQGQRSNEQLKSALQSAPTFIAGAGPNFNGVAVEKASMPKPFLVYKPGFLEKLKHHQAAYPQAGPQFQLTGPSNGGQPMAPLEISQPQPPSPMSSPISMAHLMRQSGGDPFGSAFGPSKAQIEKHGHGLNNIVPIGELETNEIGGPISSGGFGERVQQFPPPTIPQLISQGFNSPQQQHQLSQQNFGSARPISIAKQMTMDALAQQRSHILSAHLRPSGQMMLSQPQHQQLQNQQPQSQIQMTPQQFQSQFAQQQQQPNQGMVQVAPPQFHSHHQFESPNQQQQAQQKMFGRPMEMSQLMQSQMSSFPQQEQQQSAKMRFLPQQDQSPVQIPQPQVSSTITMPEPNQKVDPRRELQEQINFVLQNSPNLSEGSRNRHRGDIMKAVQESMADSDTSGARPTVAVPKSPAPSQQSQQSQSQSQNPFESFSSQMAQMSQMDSLIPQSFSPSSFRSESQNPETAGYGPSGQTGKLVLDTPYMTSSYKNSPPPMGQSSRHAPESSTYARYNQESTMFLPQDGASRASAQGSQGQSPDVSAMNHGYKAKLQQEIQRYLQDQIDKSNAAPVNFITGPNGPVFTLSGQGALQSAPASAHPMLKYQQSPLRNLKMVNLIEKNPGGSSLFLNSDSSSQNQQNQQRTRESSSQADAPPHHYILARQTEYIQPSSSQPSSSTVKAPESASSSQESAQKGASSLQQQYSSLMSQLAAAAASASSPSPVSNIVPESSKTMRGYSEWWKESALAQARPMVPIAALYPTGIAQ